MTNIAFVNPEYFYLFLLILVIGIWYFLQRKKIQSNILFSDTSGIGSGKTLKNQLIHLPFILILLAGAFLIIALARPQSTSSWEDSTTDGIDIILSMDISGSMLAEDLKPNRLEASKNVALDFISKRVNDRIGLVVLSGESFTQ